MDGTQWKCRNGHLLGHVQRVQVGGQRVSRLLLFREAVDLSANGDMAEVDVMAVVEGTVLDVKCSCCGAFRPWYEDVVMKAMVGTYLAE